MSLALKYYIRALRLPFITASLLPFISGSLAARGDFNLLGFCLGLICVMFTHLSANLINDHADSKSGADWQERAFWGFFGGSKLIQENVLPEAAYIKAAVFFACAGTVCAALISALLRTLLPLSLYAIILALAWLYSRRPLQFSYNRLGELIVFILFGPVPVMGGYFIQTHCFPSFKSFLLSLPFGFLTTAILFANEVPDFKNDAAVKKINWVSLTGPFIIIDEEAAHIRIQAVYLLVEEFEVPRQCLRRAAAKLSLIFDLRAPFPQVHLFRKPDNGLYRAV